jgi:hypothetical protein
MVICYSVYAMMLAQNLPNIPDGVDVYNQDVQKILSRIRDESGSAIDRLQNNSFC